MPRHGPKDMDMLMKDKEMLITDEDNRDVALCIVYCVYVTLFHKKFLVDLLQGVFYNPVILGNVQ